MLNRLYNIAENEHIDILDHNWNSSKARIIQLDNKYYIVLNNKKIVNLTEEKEIMAEELRSLFLQCFISN